VCQNQHKKGWVFWNCSWRVIKPPPLLHSPSFHPLTREGKREKKRKKEKKKKEVEPPRKKTRRKVKTSHTLLKKCFFPQSNAQ
jgi:hypothetical protein